MQRKAFDKILEQIASVNQVTPSEVREKMQLAMEDAMENPDPAVQAMWASIPRKGSDLTLDEFMDYLIERNLLLPYHNHRPCRWFALAPLGHFSG